MRSRASCFNLNIAGHISARYWPLWALYAVAMILLGPVPLMSELTIRSANDLRIINTLLNNVQIWGLFVCLIAASCAALAVFTPLYGRDSSIMEAVLPVKRETRYITSYLTGLFWLLIINLASFLLMTFICIIRSADLFEGLLSWLGIITLQTVAFYGIACFAAMLTGRLVIAVGLTCFLHFGAVILGVLGTSLLEYCLFGYLNKGVGDIYAILSPVVRLLSCDVRYVDIHGETVFAISDAVDVIYTGWRWLLIYATAGIVLAALGLCVYKHRKLETAGETVSEKILRPLFLCAFTLYGGLGLGELLYEIFSSYRIMDGSRRATLIMGLCLMVGAFIAYIFGVMILNRSVSLKHKLRGFALPAAAVILFTALCLTGMLGWSYSVPEAEDVESVAAYYTNSGYWPANRFAEHDTEKVIEIHRSIIENRNKESSGRYINVWFEYKLKNGRVVTRTFHVPQWEKESDPLYSFEKLLNRPELIKNNLFHDTLDLILCGKASYQFELYYNGEWYTDMPTESADGEAIILRGIFADIDAGKMGRVDFSQLSDEKGTVSDIKPEEANWINFTVIYGDTQSYCNIDITPECTNTLSVLRELGYIE